METLPGSLDTEKYSLYPARLQIQKIRTYHLGHNTTHSSTEMAREGCRRVRDLRPNDFSERRVKVRSSAAFRQHRGLEGG